MRCFITQVNIELISPIQFTENSKITKLVELEVEREISEGISRFKSGNLISIVILIFEGNLCAPEFEVLTQINFSYLWIIGEFFGCAGFKKFAIDHKVCTIGDGECLIDVVVGDED